MTLLDYYAGLAMQGVLSDPKLKDTMENICAWSYEIARVMLEERAKPENQL